MSPSRGPLVTTRLNTELIRPRSRSGVSVWLIVRAAHGAESVCPARDRETDRGGDDRAHQPGDADREPQTRTIAIVSRPRRFTYWIQPEPSTETVPPTAIAVYRSPVPPAPAW